MHYKDKYKHESLFKLQYSGIPVTMSSQHATLRLSSYVPYIGNISHDTDTTFVCLQWD